jgi:microcin C transport system permease protein
MVTATPKPAPAEMTGLMSRPWFSELTRERWRRFTRMRRAYFSLMILATAFILSLFSEFISNDKPLYLRFEGKSFFPIVKFYPASAFGLGFGTAPDYHALREDPSFKQKGGFMIMPLIPWGPYRAHLELAGNPPHAPSRIHWLGTDTSGRDVLSRLLYGFRIGMGFALCLAAVAALLGILIGGVQGLAGGWLDITAQRIIEIWSALPFLYVVILLGSIYGRSFALLLGITAAFEWIGLSYYMRGEFLRLKSAVYVRAARASGLSWWHIFRKEILPNALTPAITVLPFMLVGGISALTALDFLGFGLQPPTPSWGELLHQALENLHAPWLAITTVLALFITLLLATFVGEGVREAFDPKAGHRVE